MARLVLRVKRGGRMLGSWSLGDEPLELTVVDIATGEELGTFTAAGPSGEPDEPDTRPSRERTAETPTDPIDEVPVMGAAQRVVGDDFTMPLPELTEATEPTADFMPDTAETEEQELAARVRKSRPRPIPNLASLAGDGPRHSDLPTQEVPLAPGLDDPALEEETLLREGPPLDGTPAVDHGAALSAAIASTESGLEEIELENTGFTQTAELELDPDTQTGLESAERDLDEIDLEGLEDEPAEEDVARPTSLGEVVPPAEVWVRRQSEWRSGGHLRPGQRAIARGGWVRLRRDGRLVVRPGPSLSGSATLVDGKALDIAKDVPPMELPAGASVLLRAGEYGIYVRSEAYSAGGLPIQAK